MNRERSGRDSPRGLEHGLPYYVLLGLILGIYAAWASLAFNLAGSLAVGQEPFKLLRVYATFFMGQEALAAQEDVGIVLGLAFGLHTVTGAIVGMPLYVIYRRFFSDHGFRLRALNGIWLGILMWVINFYGILTWFQPTMLGWLSYPGDRRAYIVGNIPFWVAALTHLCFTEVLFTAEPFWGTDNE